MFISVDMEILTPFISLYTLRLRLRMYLATSGCWNIQSVLLVMKTGVPCENHRPAVCHLQTVPHNAVSKQQLNNQSIKLIQTENLPPRWAPKTIVTNTKTTHLIIVSMLSCTCDISLRLQVDIYIHKLILESHVIVYVFWLVYKVEVIFICTESENRRRFQGVACRCHQAIFFKWGTFGVI
jgi:hypothetical protein